MKTRSGKVIEPQDDISGRLPTDETPLGDDPEFPNVSQSAGPSAGTGVASQGNYRTGILAPTEEGTKASSIYSQRCRREWISPWNNTSTESASSQACKYQPVSTFINFFLCDTQYSIKLVAGQHICFVIGQTLRPRLDGEAWNWRRDSGRV